MAQLSPYLSYEGNAREAMNFYKDCLGGELQITNVSDMPEMAKQMPESMKNSVLHSELKSGDVNIYATDCNREKPEAGNMFSLCLNCKDEEELKTLFDKLSKDGKVIDEPKQMPWGDLFGSLKDKFGKDWLFNAPIKK